MVKRTVLTTILVIAMLCLRAQAATPENVIKETIVKHSIEMNVDPALALSIAKKESGFKHELKSSHGAVGVFQLLPSTAKKMGYNPYYLSENIKAGLTYYKMMYKMFGSTELALAAYNAGPGNVKRYGGTIPPYSETKRFVNQIMTEYHKQKNNPDPVIIKAKNVQKEKEILKKEQVITESPAKPKVPVVTEIPEIKRSEPAMEIL